jgi:hypothetical protein
MIVTSNMERISSRDIMIVTSNMERINNRTITTHRVLVHPNTANPVGRMAQLKANGA